MTSINYQPEKRIDFTNNREILDVYYEFLNEHNPDDQAEYQEEKIRLINQGQSTWVKRNFDDTNGAVYDYFVNGKHIGFVDVDDTNMVSAYLNTNMQDGPEKIFDGNPDELAEGLVIGIALTEQIAEIELQTESKN